MGETGLKFLAGEELTALNHLDDLPAKIHPKPKEPVKEKINLNAANIEELEKFLKIESGMAKNIISYKKGIGEFRKSKPIVFRTRCFP